MPGKKRFDETRAIEAAMIAFWENGYEATSISLLEKATGLNKSSLYNAFDNKEALFGRCLDFYAERYSARVLAALAAPQFDRAIRDLLTAIIRRPDAPSGCLATMAAMENPAEPIEARLTRELAALREAVEARAQQALEDRELRAAPDPGQLSASIVAIARGVAVLDRTPHAGDAAEAAIDGFIKTTIAPMMRRAQRNPDPKDVVRPLSAAG